MNRVPVPDNLHFYQKNPNNVLSVNLSLTGDQSIGLDYSKSIGQSEVAITLLGLPREEMRQVLYEDVPSYGFDRNRWNAIVKLNDYNYTFYDINGGLQASTRKRFFTNSKKDIAAGEDVQYDPDALNFPCPTDGLPNKSKYFTDRTFQPIIYQDGENTSITMEGWPGRHQINVYVDNPCANPQKYEEVPWYQSDYFLRLESKETYRYEPGKILGMTFGIATSVDGVSGRGSGGGGKPLKTSTWGAENNTDSYYFKLKGNQLYIGRRSLYTQNTVEIPRSEFLDPLDGTGASGIKIDFTKVTMYALEFSWYGAIGCTFYAYLPYESNKTKWVRLAELPASNTFERPALADPYMRMFLELTIPHGVPKPHFLRKHGTSVYVDGGSVDKKKAFSKSASLITPVKFTGPISQESRNILTLEIGEKNGRSATGMYNRTKIFPSDLQAYFDNSVMLDVTISTQPQPQSWPSQAYNVSWPLRHIFYPTKIWKLKPPYNNAMFFNYSSTYGWVRPVDNSINTRNNMAGASGDFYPSYFDYVFNLQSNIFPSDPGSNFSFNITIPSGADTNAIIRDLLGSQPYIYDRSLTKRTTEAWQTNNHFNGNLFSIGPANGNYPNWIYGLDPLPVVALVEIVNSTTLKVVCKQGLECNSDGVFINGFSTSDLTPEALSNAGGTYPNYGPNHHGYVGMANRTFGGYKTVKPQPNGLPLYLQSDCKICFKKNSYRNNSFYIFNAAFDTGRVYFNYPALPGSIFCVQKVFLDYVESQNWFKNKTFSSGRPGVGFRDNAVEYLLANSEFRLFAQTKIGRDTNVNHVDFGHFRINDKFYYYPNEWYRWLKETWYPVRSTSEYDLYPFQVKFIDYKTDGLERTGMEPVAGGVSNPYEPFEGSSTRYPIIQPQHTVEFNGIAGFEINRFKFRIALKPTSRSGDSWTISLEDVQYLNEDGLYTSSTSFYMILVNNVGRLGGINKLFLQPGNIDLTFNNLYLPTDHMNALDPKKPDLNVPDSLVSFEFSQGNPPWRGFFSYNQNLDYYNIVVTIKGVGLPVGNTTYTLEGEFRAVTCLHNSPYPANNVLKDNVAAMNTFIIGSSGKDPSPLYFGFSINSDLSATGEPYNYKTGKLQRLTSPATMFEELDNYDNAIAVTEYSFKDYKGNIVESTGAYYSSDIEEIPITYAGPGADLLNIQPTTASLNSTRWSNKFTKLPYIRARANISNNDNVNSLLNLKKFSYLVLANTKTKISFDSIFGLAKTQILPTRFGSATPYEAVLNISARTLAPGQKAQGMAVINFEETV